MSRYVKSVGLQRKTEASFMLSVLRNRGATVRGLSEIRNAANLGDDPS